MFLNQFLLTKSKSFKEKWSKFRWQEESIGDGEFTLFCHPNLSIVKNSLGNVNFYLIGSLYDWEFPELTDQEIIDFLAHDFSISTIFEKISKYSGEYVFIFLFEGSLIIFNDTTAQREIYFDTNFQNIGSQVTLLSQGMELIPHDNEDAVGFYNSEVFKERRLFVGDSTHVKNVKHLVCNHFLDLSKGTVTRFFPDKLLTRRSVNEVANQAAIMIKGFLKAISLRHEKIALAVTGGYDSRVLFLASLGLDEEKCSYFVLKHLKMPDTHHDLILSSKLTSIYGKHLTILEESKIPKIPDIESFKKSVDFPAENAMEDALKDRVYINGNVYEIARSVFGYWKNASAEDLAFILGYGKLRFPASIYREWLKNKRTFEKRGYHYLDFLYWEERMGIWLSKGKTEQLGLNKNVISPYNSRQLVNLTLSVDRKYRGRHLNRLQNEIIAVLSEYNEEVIKMPINPTRKRKFYRTLFKLNLYNFFRYVGLKFRLY